MTTDQTVDGALSPELEAIAAAAHDRLHAQAGNDLSAIDQAGRCVADAASEYEQAISRAGRLGLSHREIAAAAQVSHGTIRAILTRASTITDNGGPADEQPPHSEPGEIAA